MFGSLYFWYFWISAASLVQRTVPKRHDVLTLAQCSRLGGGAGAVAIFGTQATARIPRLLLLAIDRWLISAG